MRHELTIKDCRLAGLSDLTVIAPIKQGFVPALDAVTYKTRTKRVLKALHIGRSLSHQFDLGRMLSDAVERVGQIHSVRIAVIEPEDAVLLAVTFDGAWESYVRVIWQKVARLLDLIFCNTENYVNGWQNSYEDWGRWLRSRQAETSFLYATPNLTVGDTRYLRMQERLQRHQSPTDPASTQLTEPAPEEIAYQWFSNGTDPTRVGLDTALSGPVEAQPALFRQGLRSLVGLYRLADVYPPYPPGNPEGIVLHRAAEELLPDFLRLLSGPNFLQLGWDRAQGRFSEPLAWLVNQPETIPAVRVPPPLPMAAPTGNPNVQGGILLPYDYTEHGALLLLACRSPRAIAALLRAAPPTTAAVQAAGLAPGTVTLNVALSVEGLRVAGLSDAEVDQLPTEFAQGMALRAPVLGDMHMNHPARWNLPALNWAKGVAALGLAANAPGDRVSLDAVHVVLQARYVDAPIVATGGAATPQAVARAAILATLQAIVAADADVLPLSLQWMARNRNPTGQIVEHFGFQDGQSDPVFDTASAGRFYPNQVHLGEALIGHANAADAQPAPPTSWTGQVLNEGSFLVIRKLRQDVPQLDAVVAATAAALPPEECLGRLMGRWPNTHAKAGQPLVGLPATAKNPNDFYYGGDPAGQGCPFHAHIRRANPRTVVPTPLQAQMAIGGRPPRLFRRGMSYGPLYDRADAAASAAQERGIVFMAYNASIGEQFEVVQRWLAGGNSSGGFSGQSDPFVGVAEPGVPREYRFEAAGGATVRMTLDGDRDMLAEPRPLVRLEWGGYFLTPSRSGLDLLIARADATATGAPRVCWSVAQGEEAIAALLDLEKRDGCEAAKLAWKAALEDPDAATDFTTASIWAAIRARPGGALRTPYGVLVGSRQQVERTLLDSSSSLTSTAYLNRMRRSFGAIYLGLDDGAQYRAESPVCNKAIMDRDLAATRDRALQVTLAKIDALVAEARTFAQQDELLRRAVQSPPRDVVHWELTIDARELIDELLATFCEDWFLLRPQDARSTPQNPFGDQFLRRSGFRWTWKPGETPSYPGHFLAPSRYIFQPHPEPEVEDVGAAHGQAMLTAMRGYLGAFGTAITAPVTRAVLDNPPGNADPDLAARNIIGALMGMVPTVDANLRRVVDAWLTEGTLGSLRALAPAGQAGAAQAVFAQTLQARPAPDTLWRTATRSYPIDPTVANPLIVQPNEIVVAGLTSAAQENLENGVADVSLTFGGDRTNAAGHPTHACPGYKPAMAMMEGFVTALVATPWPLRPGPAPLTISVDGHDAFPTPIPTPVPTPVPPAAPPLAGAPAAVPGGAPAAAPAGAVAATPAATAVAAPVIAPAAALSAPPVAPAARLATVARRAFVSESPVPVARAVALQASPAVRLGLARPQLAAAAVATVPLCAFGDSWLAELPLFPYLIQELPALGYEVKTGEAQRGLTLKEMADKADDWARAVADNTAGTGGFKAILLGGGGNDIVQPTTDPTATALFKMLVPAATTAAQALDPTALGDFVDVKLAGFYEKILKALTGATNLPILVHAYDFPIPDGRPAAIDLFGQKIPVAGPWLGPVFDAQGMSDLTLNTQIMKILIGELNTMVATVAAGFAGQVHHMDLTGTLDATPATPDYKDLWDNELHPTQAGYVLLAQKIAAKLASLGVV